MAISPRYRSRATELAELHYIWDSLVNALAILFNGLLLFLNAFCSSKRMRPYEILLGIDASLDFVLSVLMLIALPIFLNAEGGFVVTCNGYFASLSQAFDAWLMITVSFIMHLNVTWIATQFAFRYILLRSLGE
ncbi:hypothetical protein AAVH_20451 [Aphelenchoides avenae]|nr:hypothetical protein AAVH_20451 [Aphelenchus avenae]